MNRIAVANQKGGVGKTTTAINIATALSAVGWRVLLVDLDPQGNASTGLGVDQKQREITSYDVMMGNATVDQAVVSTKLPRLDIVPATRSEEHTSELQSLMRISYAVFCLKKQKT